MKQLHPDRYEVALEAALRHLELESAISALLCESVERIVKGTYGRCLKCASAIAPERLRALPWVKLCAQCQDAADQKVSGIQHRRLAATGTKRNGQSQAISANQTNSQSGCGSLS